MQYGDTHSVLLTKEGLTSMLAVSLYKPAQHGTRRSRQCTCMRMCSTAHRYVDMQSLQPGYSALKLSAMLKCPSNLGQAAPGYHCTISLIMRLSHSQLPSKKPPMQCIGNQSLIAK